jgi:hypothetical protein
VSKSRRPASRRSASSSRRKPAKKAAAKKSRRPPTRRGGDAIELKPIRDEIIRAVEGLKKFPPSEPVKITIERLERCLTEFDAICDPESPDGCGPNMAFPWP